MYEIFVRIFVFWGVLHHVLWKSGWGGGNELYFVWEKCGWFLWMSLELTNETSTLAGIDLKNSFGHEWDAWIQAKLLAEASAPSPPSGCAVHRASSPALHGWALRALWTGCKAFWVCLFLCIFLWRESVAFTRFSVGSVTYRLQSAAIERCLREGLHCGGGASVLQAQRPSFGLWCLLLSWGKSSCLQPWSTPASQSRQ